MKLIAVRNVHIFKQATNGVLMVGTEWKIGNVQKPIESYSLMLNGLKKVKLKFLNGVPLIWKLKSSSNVINHQLLRINNTDNSVLNIKQIQNDNFKRNFYKCMGWWC